MAILFTSFVMIYLVSIFFPYYWIIYLSGLLGMISVILSFSKATRLFKRTSSVFMMIGLGLMLAYDLSLVQVPVYFNRMAILISLFVMLPFMNSIITAGRYDKHVNKLMKTNIKHMGQLYYRGSLASYTVGMFLNVGVIPFVYQVIERNLRGRDTNFKKKYIASLILRGYALCLVWSPMEILVGLTIDITGASYLHLLPYLLVFSVLLLLVDWTLGKSKYQKHLLDSNSQGSDFKSSIWKNIIQLFIYLIFFIVVVSVFRFHFHLNFLTTVTLVILPYAVLWAITIRKFKFYLKYSFLVWKKKTSTLQNYVVLFLGVGFFISVLEETQLIKYLQAPVLEMGALPPVLFVFIQLMFLLLAMAGFHPLVTMTIVGEALQPTIGLIDPVAVGIVLITSGLSTVMAGPYNITVSLTSMLLNDNPYKLSLYNLKFALLFSSTGTIIALGIMWIF